MRGLPVKEATLAAVLLSFGVSCSSDVSGGTDAPVDGCGANDFSGVVARAEPSDVCAATLWFPGVNAQTPTLQSVSCAPRASPPARAELAEDLVQTSLDKALLHYTEEALPEAFVFYRDPLDWGGLAVVSASTGKLVINLQTEFLSGSTTLLGPNIDTWATPASCRATASLGATNALSLGGAYGVSALFLSEDEIAEVVARVARTPAADELASRTAPTRMLVLKFGADEVVVVIEADPVDE